jgi:hypothetical protein
MTKATKTAHMCMCLAVGLAVALPGIAKSATIDVSENQPMTPQRTTPPARDPNVAVEEEYQLARQRGTAEALELFIARHPDSPLAAKARADLRQTPR